MFMSNKPGRANYKKLFCHLSRTRDGLRGRGAKLRPPEPRQTSLPRGVPRAFSTDTLQQQATYEVHLLAIPRRATSG